MKEYNGTIKGETLTIVNSTNTAVAAQSGSLQVFGTPFMIALLEKATCRAIVDLLEDDETTVGTSINVKHTKASGIGKTITATATLVERDGRRLVFDVVASEENGDIVGSGTIERFIVNSGKFMKKVEA